MDVDGNKVIQKMSLQIGALYRELSIAQTQAEELREENEKLKAEKKNAK